MRAFLISILFLAACGQTSAPPASEPAADTAAAPAAAAAPIGEPMSAGLMGGMTEGLPNEISGLQPGAAQLTFSDPDGVEIVVPTEFLGVVAPTTLIAAGGESFAATLDNDVVTRVDLRRITGDAPPVFCTGRQATHVALVSSEPLTGLFLVVFAGPDAPGPEASDSIVCATYAYAVD